MIRAKIKPDLLDTIDAFFDGKEGHRSDPAFLAVCARIAGKEVTLRFTHGDAFEIEDDSYWLPECCWDLVRHIR
jgi:hypothetical protein